MDILYVGNGCGVSDSPLGGLFPAGLEVSVWWPVGPSGPPEMVLPFASLLDLRLQLGGPSCCRLPVPSP